MILSFGSSVRSNVVQRYGYSEEEFVQKLIANCPSYNTSNWGAEKLKDLKESLCYVLPAELEGGVRKLSACSAIRLICLDIDNPGPSFSLGGIYKCLSNLKWLGYTTFSSTTEKPRYRVMVFCDGMDVSLYADCVKSIGHMIGLTEITAESLIPSQPMILPVKTSVNNYQYGFCLDGVLFDSTHLIMEPNVAVVGRKPSNRVSCDRGLAAIRTNVDITDDQVRQTLCLIDSDCDRKTWIMVCCALKHQYYNNQDTGFEMFDSWSARGTSKYQGTEDCMRNWDSVIAFPTDREPITFRSLLHMVNQMKNKTAPPTTELLGDFVSIYYVKELNEMYDVQNDERYDMKQFNAVFGRTVKQLQVKASAWNYCLNELQVPIANSYVYYPGMEKVIDVEGVVKINLYVHYDQPDMELALDRYGNSKQLINFHLSTLFPIQEEFELVRQFLARCVQDPTLKIRWSLMIQGCAGSGKTTLAEFMKVCIGDQAVGIATYSDIVAPFNEWFLNKQLIVLEDVTVDIRNPTRYMQIIKNYITDAHIPLRIKHKPHTQINNCTNFIAFSEYRDAVIVEPYDRRWCILHSDIQDKEQLKRSLNDEHFKQLYNVIKNYPGHILRYFKEIPLDPNFDPNSAPSTGHKDDVIEMSKPSLQAFIEGLIAKNDALCNACFISRDWVYAECNSSNAPLGDYEIRTVKQTLGRLGYRFYLKVRFAQGDTHTIYANTALGNGVSQADISSKFHIFNEFLTVYNFRSKANIIPTKIKRTA